MTINLENLSPKELQAVIADAESKMKSAHSNLVKDIRKKIDALLITHGLTLAEIYPTRGGRKATNRKGSVAPKYRDLVDPTKTWSGRGKRPLWFVQAIKKRGVTAENLLIDGATTKAPAKAAKKTAKKSVTKITKA